MTKTRFAPSPTGFIHIGNIRTALMCYLLAKQNNGEFWLRLDDTDTERSKEEYAQAIIQDLEWLGLGIDHMERQSARLARYEEVKQQLIESGRLYPCYETAQEIEVKRKMQLNRGLPPIYDRTALTLTDAQKQAFEAEGRQPHYRFKIDQSAIIQWQDLIRGDVHFEGQHLSDPVLIRENGNPTYMLPSTIDDMDFGISHVLRGEDHVTNTAIQIQLFEALGASVPVFAHHSLIKSKTGKISKREGGHDIAGMREEGIEPMAFISYLARIGTSQPVEPFSSMEEVIAQFDLSHFSRASAIFDQEELERLNSKIVHGFSYQQVQNRRELAGIDKKFWDAVKDNLERVGDIHLWHHICREEIVPDIEDMAFTKQACELLPDGNWDETTWSSWTNKVKEATGRKGKDLFMPIRKALTGRDNGPELKILLPLIGSEKAHRRLNGQKA